ncbi:MAG: hypothetical protein AABZ12_09985 [Planctomycetota bacterium]
MVGWRVVIAGVVALALSAGSVTAQTENPHGPVVDTIRPLQTISASDQARIVDWVRFEVEALQNTASDSKIEAAKRFGKAFLSQFESPQNTQAFRGQFATQAAIVAAEALVNPQADQVVSGALARVMLDMNRPETVPGFVAGLKCKWEWARYLCARGLAAQQGAIATDKDKLEQVVRALREAGETETGPVALEQVYRTLAIPNQQALVIDAYLSILDRRLAAKKTKPEAWDGAENAAFEYLRVPALLNGLSAPQKSQLVIRLAGFLRLAAERYAAPNLSFTEIDDLERSLDATEEMLETLAGAGGGNIRKVLENQGYAGNKEVLAEAKRWIGDKESTTPGLLNAAPWSIPQGAP